MIGDIETFLEVFAPRLERSGEQPRTMQRQRHANDVACTSQEFSVSRVQIARQPSAGPGWEDHSREVEEAPLGDLPRQGIVALMIEVGGAKSVPKLAARLSEIGGVTLVRIGNGDPAFRLRISAALKGGLKACLSPVVNRRARLHHQF
jgi:hypothetical protein